MSPKSAERIARGVAFALVASMGLYVPARVLTACSSSSSPASTPSEGGQTLPDGGAGVAPIAGLSQNYLDAFYDGERAFEAVLTPADGLGPLYTKTACVECHGGGARGPGASSKMVVVGPDGLTPSSDQSMLPFGNTEHPLLVTEIPGVHTPILPPFDGGVANGDAGTLSIRVTTRLGPPIFGRGYMEAIADSEIERMEAQQATRTDGVHGRVNHLPFASQADPDPTFDPHKPGETVIGRFGLKARIATLDEFAADALQGDMGITSPMRPTEFANPDGVTDDLKQGVDVAADVMNARGMYVRLLDIPPRDKSSQVIQGKAWFSSGGGGGGCGCDTCHQPTLHTRADYPIPQLADIDAAVYTDMLLHDMGDGLSDSVEAGNEGAAESRDWRTLPLIGLRFCPSFMHDGRAATIEDAINAHDSPGSEAAAAAQCFKNLAPIFHQQLIVFVSSL